MTEAARWAGQLPVAPLTVPLLFGLIWVLLLLAASLWLPRLLRSWTPAPPVGAAVSTVVALAVAVRLIPNLISPVGAAYDIGSYHIWGIGIWDYTYLFAWPRSAGRELCPSFSGGSATAAM